MRRMLATTKHLEPPVDGAPVVRFAPSPTGRIHIGNARTALLNYFFAKKHGGRFILRFDDTDVERSTVEFARGIEVDLAWLGVDWDESFRQSDRSARYEAVAAELKAAGLLYPCFETPDELERKRKLQAARGAPPVYDRAALKISDAERQKFLDEGRRPHWRFKLAPDTIHWDDLIRGASHIDCASLSDPVLIRADGSFLYTLPSVIDDFDSGVTHIIRGEDHVTNTAVQIQLFGVLGAKEPPAFGHHNLLIGADGQGLSKRTGALSIAGLREAGVEPLAVAAMATLTGSSIAVRAVESLPELAGLFDLAAISRNSARFDEAELLGLSQKVLHGLDYEHVRDRLEALGVVGFRAEPLWEAAKGNLSRFDEILDWFRLVEEEFLGAPLAPEFCEAARKNLPDEPFDETSWGVWTGAIKQATGLKGRALFHPLRLALTGRESGPELAKLLPLIGRARVLERLRTA